MRILYYYIEAQTYVGSWPKIHYIDELERYGHQITIFDPYSFSCIDEANEKLISFIKDKTLLFDLFMNPYGGNVLYVETIKLIKSMGIPTLLICFDNLQVPFIHREIAPYFDLVWLTSKETAYLFQKWGCKYIFLPYAANPYIFKPCFDTEINAVGFVGTPYGTRTIKINDLVSHGIRCEIYSDALNLNISGYKMHSKIKVTKNDFLLMRFPIGRKILLSKIKKKFIDTPKLDIDSQYLRKYPSVSFDEMNKLYSNFALSLGITEVWDTYLLKHPVHKLHLRTFEIPMCGGIQFAPYIDELADYFDNDKEIVMYKTKEEYIDKAKFYLQDSRYNLRLKIKIAARRKAENEHTWMNRFNKIFKLI